MKTPIISVIVPFYNVELYFKQCLDSLTCQTFEDFEVLCIDDCGQDDSLAIAQKFVDNDPRFKIIRHGSNQGLGGARNTGLAHAKGKYISFIDSDDWIAPDMLARHYQAIETRRVESVWSHYYTVFENGERTVRKCTTTDRTGLTMMTPHLIASSVCAAWNKLYRLDAIKNHGMKFRDKIFAEDLGFYYQFYSLSKSVFIIDEPFYMYRHRPDSIMAHATKHNNAALQLIEVFKDCYHHAKEQCLPQDMRDALMELASTHASKFIYCKQYKKPFIQGLQRFLGETDFPVGYHLSDENILRAVRTCRYKESCSMIYKFFLFLNQMVPFPSLRRRGRTWLKVNFYLEKV